MRILIPRYSLLWGTLIMGVLLLGNTVDAQSISGRTTLGNDLQVMAVQLPESDIASVSLVFLGGSGSDEPGQAGWLHLMEQMLWKGHEGAGTRKEFLARGNRLGAIRRSVTEADWVTIMLTLPRDSIQAGLDYLLSVVREPLFDEDELGIEKQVLLQELDRLEANPQTHLWRAVDQIVSGRRGNGVWADPDAIFTASSETLRLLKLRRLVPNNGALVVASDIPPDHIFDLARLSMGQWPEGFPDELARRPQRRPGTQVDRDTIVVQQVELAHWVLAWPVLSSAGIAQATANLLARMLVHPAGPFYRRLVDGGPVLKMTADYRLGSSGNTLVLDMILPLDRVLMARAIVGNELLKMSDPLYFTPGHLRASRARQLVREQQTMVRPWEVAWETARKLAAARFGNLGNRVKTDDVNLEMLFRIVRKTIVLEKPHSILMVDSATRRALEAEGAGR